MTSHRYGAPVGRYAAVERVVVIGAPPLTVSTGAPGARAEVRAYAARLDADVERLHAAFRAWLLAKWGDVPPDAQTVPTPDERAFTIEWPPWYAEWNRWVDQIDSFDPLGPTPTQAWQKTELYDAAYEGFRKRFAALATGVPGVKVPAPGADPGGTGGHEEPGGVAQPGLLDSLGGDSLGTIATVLIIGGVAWILSSVAGIAGR